MPRWQSFWSALTAVQGDCERDFSLRLAPGRFAFAAPTQRQCPPPGTVLCLLPPFVITWRQAHSVTAEHNGAQHRTLRYGGKKGYKYGSLWILHGECYDVVRGVLVLSSSFCLRSVCVILLLGIPSISVMRRGWVILCKELIITYNWSQRKAFQHSV